MKSTLSTIILLSLSLGLLAQTPKFNVPDYRNLKKELNGKNSSYEKLMQRYTNFDTTLTMSDYHLLYYGYTLQPDYNPQKETTLRDSLYQAFSRNQSGEADFNKIQSLAFNVLQELPFDIRTLDPAIYATEMLKDHSLATKMEHRLGRLVETIFNSGDGLTQDTPFFVVSTANESDVIRALGFTPSTTAPMQSNTLHYWKVKENEFGVEGFYFGVFSAKR